MDWTEIIIALLGSSVIAGAITAIAERRTVKANARKVEAEIGGDYADRLEKRINTLEIRQERYEMRDSIQQSALNCAHKCKIPDDECPVLIYLEQHPVMSITESDHE